MWVRKGAERSETQQGFAKAGVRAEASGLNTFISAQKKLM